MFLKEMGFEWSLPLEILCCNNSVPSVEMRTWRACRKPAGRWGGHGASGHMNGLLLPLGKESGLVGLS